MKRLQIILLSILCIAFATQAQNNVGINDDHSSPNASAMLDVYSTTKGMLIPRVALTLTTSASPISSPAASLLVYNTATAGDVTPGYYYWNGSTQWVRLTASSDTEHKLNMVSKSANATLLKTETVVLASGNITLTLPEITGADDGLSITVKNIGTCTDLITVLPAATKKIDASTFSPLTRWLGKTYIASGSNWIVKEKETRQDNRLDVSASGSFTTIAEVLAFLNLHMSGPTVVELGGGTYQLGSTQTINLPYPVTFQGTSYGETNIDATAGVSGSTMFNCASECYFKMLIFNAIANTAGNDAIRFTGSGVYHEVKDCVFDGFNKGIVSTTNSDLWIFENDFENCAGAGIEIAAGGATGGRLRISETDFVKCAKGINLLSGVSEIVSILNCAFYNTASGSDVGIVYTPATFTTFSTMFISNNAWNNQGTFISGFDNSRTDGRDANAFIVNNLGNENENPHCKLTLLNNTTFTSANGSSWVKANWTATSPTLTTYTCKWNVATTNRVIYQPVNKTDVLMWISGNVSNHSSGNARTINVAICKNGVTTTRYGETTFRTGTQDQPFQFSTVVYLSDVGQNDYFELFFSSSSGVNDDMVFSDLNWFSSSH